MINIAELLKDAPEGTELWFTLYGKVKFMSVNFYETYPIQIRLNDNTVEKLDKYGRFFDHYEDAECVLFPSKDCRTWEGWKAPIEPKFKVGDWVVFNNSHNSIYQISEIRDSYYMLTHTHGGSMPLSFSQGKLIRPWTIEDAKDGDVITNGKLIVIFNKLEEPAYRQHIIAYVGLDLCGKIQITEDTWRLGIDKAMPATKEQHDLLFAKMREVECEWDAEKKELHKIQPHYDIANFKPFDKVLVRDTKYGNWNVNLFSYYIDDIDARIVARFHCIDSTWIQCIPFNDDTKHLLGTTDPCGEEYINW